MTNYPPSATAVPAQTYAAVGVTWWLEHLVPVRWASWSNWPLEAMRQRIRQGPTPYRVLCKAEALLRGGVERILQA